MIKTRFRLDDANLLLDKVKKEKRKECLKTIGLLKDKVGVQTQKALKELHKYQNLLMKEVSIRHTIKIVRVVACVFFYLFCFLGVIKTGGLR